ncbi:MAG: potassium-transporting ATPase subunit KdpC [Hungatella hathewayi]|nr:potassium-transporting ATPase subunit KdpC [Hungatella hathewayi]
MFKRVFKKTAILFFIMMVLCGLIYTLVVTGISQVLFHDKASGSIIEIDGVKYGSSLLGQQYTDESHMWGRIVMTDTSLVNDNGETVLYAWASNKSPAGEEFETAVAERVAMIQEANPDADMEAIPVELVTSSGSGLDPHISPAAAEYQIPRIAKAKGMMEDEVRAVVDRYTDGKLFGILGEETVNVLKVNLALDGILTE